jgi:hypothetical protein
LKLRSPERLGPIVYGCVLREAHAAGGRRHHHYTGVLRDFKGNVWECEHLHPQQEEAHECARVEHARRATLTREADTDRVA